MESLNFDQLVEKCISFVAPEVEKLEFKYKPSYGISSDDFSVSDKPEFRFEGALASLNRPVKVVKVWPLEELFAAMRAAGVL